MNMALLPILSIVTPLMVLDELKLKGKYQNAKHEPTTPNMSQHVATWWPNARNMLRPTMLRYVALTCCDRLTGAL